MIHDERLTETRRVGEATCVLRFTTAVPVHLQGRVTELANLHVPREERRKGHATALIREVCRDADTARHVLVMWPRSYDHPSLSQSALIEWYQTFGFVGIQDDPYLMARAPSSLDD